MPKRKIVVQKFGGSSLATASKIEQVCDIIRQNPPTHQSIVVLSAMGGVTDMLIEIANEAARHSASESPKRIFEKIATLRDRHLETLHALSPDGKEPHRNIEELFKKFTDILNGVILVHECSGRTMDYIMSFGERLCCEIVGESIRTKLADRTSVALIDARTIIETDSAHGQATVDMETSRRKILNRLMQEKQASIIIIPGFIASTKEGITTTLGRNGSDFTASLVGASLDAEKVEIWTDVDGVLSADPQRVKNCTTVPYISYQEAMELSYFGAKVIHPYTMHPVIAQKIPIYIRNTNNAAHHGTTISPQRSSARVTGIASINHIALINITGSGMVGMPGIAAKIFSTLAEHSINVIMIAQASSEHSICLGCTETEAKIACKVLNEQFQFEIENRRVDPPQLITDLEIIAVISTNIRNNLGIAGEIFGTLGRIGINIAAIAQGASAMNISCVVAQNDSTAALQQLHDTFFAVHNGVGEPSA